MQRATEGGEPQVSPSMANVARGIEFGETRGFMKAIVDADTNQILGCAILGMEGGEVMTVLQVAMMGKLFGCKNRVRLLLPDFLAFCFVQSAQALLNSTPQLLARDRRAVAQGAQFGPGDLRMDAAA
jgi:Pyridine nucleotide-disulphide oxidoreductase, dimerisation domain